MARKAEQKPAITGKCAVCGRPFPKRQLHSWITVRPGLSDLIERDGHEWREGAFICDDDLSAYRRRYVESLLEDERGEIGALVQPVWSEPVSGWNSLLYREITGNWPPFRGNPTIAAAE